MRDFPESFEQLHNAGMLGSMAYEKKDATLDGLPPELKQLGDVLGKSLKDLRDGVTDLEKSKVGETEFKSFTEKANTSIDKIDLAISELKKSGIGKAADAPDERKAAIEYMAINKKMNLLESEVTAEHIAEAKAYEADFGLYFRRGVEGKALSSGHDPSGGWWVPTTYSNRIIERLQESTPMRSLATVEVVNGDKWEVQNDRQQIAAVWVDDVSRANSATEKLGMKNIMVHNLQRGVLMTTNLLDDATRNPEEWAANKAAISFSLAEATAFLLGDGAGKPRGLLTYAPVEYSKADDKADASWGKMSFVKMGHASTIASADGFLKLITSLRGVYRANASFLMERMAMGEVRLLKDTNGRYLLDYDLTKRAQASIFGYPMAEGDDMATIAANAFPVAFGDFKQAYTIVQRRAIRTLRDPYSKKPMVEFDFTARVGGDVVDFDAFRVGKIAA